MDRRRAGGAPALWRRVRWGNVGRLAVLLAAGFLIVTSGPGGGKRAPVEVPMAVEPVPKEPLQSEPRRKPVRLPRAERRRPSARLLKEPRGGRGRHKRRRSGSPRAPRRREASELVNEDPPPAAPPVPPAPELAPPDPPPGPKRPSGGEFTPDPGL